MIYSCCKSICQYLSLLKANRDIKKICRNHFLHKENSEKFSSSDIYENQIFTAERDLIGIVSSYNIFKSSAKILVKINFCRNTDLAKYFLQKELSREMFIQMIFEYFLQKGVFVENFHLLIFSAESFL